MQTARFLTRPVRFLDECRRTYGDVFTLTLPPVGRAVFLASPEAVREVFTRDRVNVMNPGRAFLLEPVLGPRSVLLQVGEEHLRRRRLMLPPFHGERMRSYVGVMEDATRAAVARWPRGRPFPLLPEMAGITLDVILRAVFGLQAGTRADEVRAVLRDVLSQGNRVVPQLTYARTPPALRPRHPLGRKLARVDALLHEELAERRAAGDLAEREDVLSLLLLARDEDGEPLSDAELRDQLMTLLVAGHETTATGLAWAFDALFRVPGAYERLREDPSDEAWLAAIVDETLRVRPVVPEVGRRLGEAIDAGGHRLEAGTDVLASIQLLHRREDLYPEPHAFRPERFLEDGPGTYTWLAFGGGMRRCLGAAFAQVEMRTVLRTVVEEAPGLRGATDGAEPIVRRPVTIAPGSGTPALL